MTEFDVPTTVQDRLLSEARIGNFGLANSGEAEPVSVDVVRTADVEREVSRYADGSISVLESEIPTEVDPGAAAPRAITGCTVVSGSGFKNFSGCRIHYQSHIFSYGFYADYMYGNGGWDQIYRAYDQFQGYAIGHSRDSWALKVIKQHESSTGPAHAQLSIVYNVLPAFGQVTKGVRLKVGGDRSWQENS
ncbi:MAG TPA: hypothetical protein GX743_12240 [Actinomycetales bacterium]|nr:hypothetical protein [Actinomycetales bacterium]